jgi:hypothetical protein
MNWLLSAFFGAGMAAWTYSKFGRRMGYSNVGNQVKVALVVFVIATLVFYTILATIIS